MGYSSISQTARDFWPVNTPTELYLYFPDGYVISEILQMAKDHFGDDSDINNIEISAEYIHTSDINYDQYVSCDYTNFIVLKKKA
jgi:hypothetical protein